MKELLNTIAGKLSGICKSVFVAHAKACIIAGSVVVAGSAATVTTVEYVHHHSSKMQVQAQETEVETETDSNLDKLSEILTETQTESETEIETATQEEIAELVKEAVADENTSSKELYEIIDKAAENSSAPIPVKDVEDLEIVEDNSSEPSREETEVEEPEPDQPSSNDVYEISQLTYGVDVSRWQGDIDWSAVAADGITFAMIKCGGGDDGLYEDRKFQQNIQGALANGIQVGVYFYSGASNAREAYDEASYCISLIRDYQITYPVAFDWELDGDYDSVTEACETFCNVISSYGYQPMVYSNRNRWYNNFDGEKIASKYKVWMAAYFGKFYYDSVRWTYGDELPNFRYHYDMWQYSSRCYVDGISGQVDVDIAFFGYANYHVDTKDAVLTVTNKEIKRTYGDGIGRLTEELNLLDGVKGINTIGYDMDIEYSIYDESGNEYSEEEAISTAGEYTVDEENGTQKQYTGYVYETGTVSVTGGSENVVTKFLIKDDNIETSTKQEESTSAKAPDNSQKESASNIEESSKSETETSTEIKTVSYIVMEVEAQIEYIYADGWQNIKGKNYYFENSNAVTGWKNIDGVQYYFNADGSQGSSLVIDVSTYNGDIDWNSVKASGINYAMIRVGYRGYETARLVLDKRFHSNMSQATAAGIKVGAYIVTQAVDTTEAVEEASFIVSACSGYNISLPLAIDVESAGNGSGRGDKISSSQRTAVINAFSQTVRSCGYSAILYANKDWMNNRIYAGNVSCSVWLAQYNSKCTYTGPFTMWQFTEKARVNGISGNVDMSAWKH